ncbi:MAG TPA: DUF2254 family protein, partial [Solirubrobacteraceae bacterium]|nr:DUF2254 family protein [Solirubrobacteraceae bacterium]
DRVYPEPFGRAIPADGSALLDGWSREAEGRCVHPARTGYVQAVELDDLEDLRGLRVHVTVRPGDFVSEADAVARFWTADAPDEVAAALRRMVVIANERDVHQDPGYGVRQLVDIAVRALSPGVNDPTTAWTCIAYVRAIMQRLAGREFPDPVRRLGDTTVVIAEQRTFEEYVDAAYVQIARYAHDPRVSGALLQSLLSATRAAIAAGAAERGRVLASTAGVIADSALARDTDVAGREQIELLLRQIGTVVAGQARADDPLPTGQLAR